MYSQVVRALAWHEDFDGGWSGDNTYHLIRFVSHLIFLALSKEPLINTSGPYFLYSEICLALLCTMLSLF